MKYRVSHQTRYRYSESASLSQNELYLEPRTSANQIVLSSGITISPEPKFDRNLIDYFGNKARYFMIQHPHEELSITAVSEVETSVISPPPPESTPAWETVRDNLRQEKGPADFEAYQFVFPSPIVNFDSEIAAYAAESFSPGTPILTGALSLNQRIFTDFKYDKEATTVDTSVKQAFETRKGVCQDFAHLMIACLRSLGLAARYVSGYLETLPPPGKPKLVGADASHAWVSVYTLNGEWIDLDPTNNMFPEERHITLAWGRDYADVTPVKGIVMGGGSHQLSVSVEVSPQS